MSNFLCIKSISLFFVFTLFVTGLYAQADYQTTPTTNNGKKWRIGYLEGGPYNNYQSILKALVLNLMESGWIQQAPLPTNKDNRETQTLWRFLSTSIKSDYLEFPMDAYWTANWDNTLRQKMRSQIVARLKKNQEIDLILGFGTWAGLDLANHEHSTPTMVLSASNAVRAGIIKSIQDSGFDHVHAKVDPELASRQLRLFHDVQNFKRLGLAFADDSEGRSYAAYDEAQKLSRELGFQIVECKLPPDSKGLKEEEAALVKCYHELAPKIDSIYITDYTGLTKNNLKKLLWPLFKHKVSMFAQTRYDLAKYGILMSASSGNYLADGRYYSQILAKILNGAKPRDLSQVFKSPLKIVINLETARRINLRIPLDVLAGAFEIHETIQDVNEPE